MDFNEQFASGSEWAKLLSVSDYKEEQRMTVYETFMAALVVMAKGMGGIFVVMLAIFLCIKFLIRVFPEK
jgi:hypothetical protein